MTLKTAQTKTVFIDGEAGTTGLEIRDRLAGASDIAVRSIDPEKRKDPQARATLMREVDLVVLCLPDDAAKEAVALADGLGDKSPKIVDASTAHRVASGWAYGFPGARCEAGWNDRQGDPRCQPGLLSDRRHRPYPTAYRCRYPAH